MRSDSDFAGFDATGPKSVKPSAQGCESAASVSVKRLLPSAKFFQCQDITIKSFAAEVVDAAPGDVVCYHTGKDDPIVFAATALARGASAILTEQMLPCPLPQAIVGDAVEASCVVTSTLNGNPYQQMLTIGVVGDSGKTSTALMIAGLLRKIGIRTAYETDLGCSDGIVQSSPETATARGLALVEKVIEARDASAGAIVIEYSGSDPGATGGLKLDVLVVTGADSALQDAPHDTHYGPDALTVALEQTKQDAVVIVPSDHPKWIRRIDDIGLRRVTYGLRRAADVSAKVFEELPGETTLMVTCGDETAAMQTRHCGEPMALNALAALAVGILIETPLHQAIAAICDLPQIPGRMQRITGFDTAAVVIDAGGSAQRLSGTLRTLRRQRRRSGKLWCLLALDGTAADHGRTIRGDQSYPSIGRAVERFADRIILTSTDRSKSSFLKASHEVLDGFKDVAVARLVADQTKAIRWALSHAEPWDTILIVSDSSDPTAASRRRAIQRIETLVQQILNSDEVKREELPATIKMF
jgi:UDP-N-acetylmuramoyl-L-alanyl-D-glutamate--2,6-diaminopimelate ligase